MAMLQGLEIYKINLMSLEFVLVKSTYGNRLLNFTLTC
jgi:hypothetical protein